MDAEHYVSRIPARDMTGIVYPDLLTAFNADSDSLERRRMKPTSGHNAVLNIHFRWEYRELLWHDPATGRHIATFESELARADSAEARIRELEAENQRMRGDHALQRPARTNSLPAFRAHNHSPTAILRPTVKVQV